MEDLSLKNNVDSSNQEIVGYSQTESENDDNQPQQQAEKDIP
jgi:hypothetical protein